MTTQISSTGKDDKKVKVKVQGGSSDVVYGMGLIGAWVYYIGRATTPKEGVIGFFKGLFWPGFFVYELLQFMNKTDNSK